MKLLFRKMKRILSDTLKVDGRYSRTSLTMFTAFSLAVWMCFIDFSFNGLRYDVWVTLMGVALGSKITDSLTKKIHK
jgi:hypothetical protein